MQKHIPNFITLLNLTAGILSIICVIEGWFLYACYLIMVASVLDFFDGFFAKLLHVQSELGKHLDSFADLVSFGLAPTCLIYVFLGELQSSDIPYEMSYLKLSVICIPVCSVIRLAKFNIDDSQEFEFIGLPTPANALFFSSSIASLLKMGTLYKVAVFDYYILVILIVVFSLLLVSPVRFFSLKFSNYNWDDNKVRYLFIFLSAILIVGCFLTGNPIVCLSIIILLYLFMSTVKNILKKNEI